jgi:amino acid permease
VTKQAGLAQQMDSRRPRTSERELQRRLSSRQLTMIAIGGAIGVGLFLGSSVTIQLAGPGVIVTYLLGALIQRLCGNPFPLRRSASLLFLMEKQR